jgi:hypothetical protein
MPGAPFLLAAALLGWAGDRLADAEKVGWVAEGVTHLFRLREKRWVTLR